MNSSASAIPTCTQLATGQWCSSEIRVATTAEARLGRAIRDQLTSSVHRRGFPPKCVRPNASGLPARRREKRRSTTFSPAESFSAPRPRPNSTGSGQPAGRCTKAGLTAFRTPDLIGTPVSYMNVRETADVTSVRLLPCVHHGADHREPNPGDRLSRVRSRPSEGRQGDHLGVSGCEGAPRVRPPP
jgi:hypothetical protein